MSLAMTVEEREAFLADLHVGIISISDPEHGPLTVPIWYEYDPGGLVWVQTGKNSRKARLLKVGKRVSLCAQTEAPPYQYVSIEGPVVEMDEGDGTADTLALAIKYLGEQYGTAYAKASGGAEANIRVSIRPERWLTVDYGKDSG